MIYSGLTASTLYGTVTDFFWLHSDVDCLKRSVHININTLLCMTAINHLWQSFEYMCRLCDCSAMCAEASYGVNDAGCYGDNLARVWRDCRARIWLHLSIWTTNFFIYLVAYFMNKLLFEQLAKSAKLFVLQKHVEFEL